MKAIDIVKQYYIQYVEPMLESEFKDKKSRICVGLVGEGSECFKFDDDISADHDYFLDVCLFLTKEDYESFGFKLERAYSKLPKEFMGLRRAVLSPVGGNRRGVVTIEDFYAKFLGNNFDFNNNLAWLYTPSNSFATATNGEVFIDQLGEFSKIRNILKNGYPEDVRLKKLAYHTILMAQSGQYNYKRCVLRNENGAGGLALYEFIKNAISTVFLLNNQYEPYYKWAYRKMRELPILPELEQVLTGLCEFENSGKFAEQKQEIIEDVSSLLIEEFKRQKITSATCQNLETHAYSILDKIKDANLRNLHIMEG